MTTYRAELIRSLGRGTYWFLGLCLGLFVFGMLNAKSQHHVPLYGFRQAAIVVATLVMGRAATVAAGDFSSGTIRPWLISRPRRGSVWLGKLAGSITVAIGFSVVAGVAGFVMSAALGSVPSLSDTASVAGQFLLSCVAFTIFGHATGGLVRHIPVALCGTLGWVLAAEHLLASDRTSPWFPGLTAQQITLGRYTGGQYASALAHLYLPFLVIEAAALVLFLRRDINN